jgi:hypothetical protein
MVPNAVTLVTNMWESIVELFMFAVKNAQDQRRLIVPSKLVLCQSWAKVGLPSMSKFKLAALRAFLVQLPLRPVMVAFVLVSKQIRIAKPTIMDFAQNVLAAKMVFALLISKLFALKTPQNNALERANQCPW